MERKEKLIIGVAVGFLGMILFSDGIHLVGAIMGIAGAYICGKNFRRS